MAQKRRNLISTFVAADESGRKILLQHYRESELTSSAGGDVWTPTDKMTLVTEDGRDVKWKAKGVYEVLSLRGVSVLRSDDPDAP